MSKKLLITLTIVVVILIGGFLGFRIYQTQQAEKAHQAYLDSSNKVADELVRLLIAQDVQGAKKLFTQNLQNGYSDAFWQEIFFPLFKDYKGWPALALKDQYKSADPADLPPYNPALNQDPQIHLYDFRLHDLIYRVQMIVIRGDGQWKVDVLNGGYVAQ